VPEPTLVAIGLVLGAVFAWLVARAHFDARARARRRELDARIKELETLEGERRRQLTERTQEVITLRRDLATEQERRTQAETRLAAEQKNLDDQRRLLEEAEGSLRDTFTALSSEALRRSNDEFLTLAEERLGQRQKEIDTSIRPLQEALTRYEEHVREVEKARAGAYASLEAQVRALSEQAGSLVTAIRTPQARGRWGELTLRRVAELAGMSAHCDFVEQVTTENEGRRRRPDMVVHLPRRRQIVVDAKVPLTGYLEAMDASTPDQRRAALERHAQQVRAHVLALANKSYWEPLDEAIDLIVLFIPGESFFGAAAEADPALIEDAMGRRVAIASPMTLVALLRAVELGWREERMAADAQQVTAEGRELYKRVATFLRYFADVGGALGRATTVYNQAVGSLESRVLPAARRLRDLAAAPNDEVPALEPIDQAPREIAAPEYPMQPPLESSPPREERDT
jgi:DNA recombination protein RmuC